MRGPAEKLAPVAAIDALLKCAEFGVSDAGLVAISSILAKDNWPMFGALARWVECSKDQTEAARRAGHAVPIGAAIAVETTFGVPAESLDLARQTLEQAAAAALSEGS